MTAVESQAFDWAVETALQGTVSRIGRYVRGDCVSCPEKDVLVYDAYFDVGTLMCAACTRKRYIDNPHKEVCDTCGHEGAWRDPLTRRNEFFCATCHAANGTVFQNRWAEKARTSPTHSIHGGLPQAVCAAKNYGTECSGEVKWRGGFNKSLCNKHAGKKSNGPERDRA